ncbi:hypothetical protein SOJ69_12440 [Pseudomonas aeruginosa]|uniref:hypothetical protein n=1 Tax=Pseudomonas aeruginosa TaxID=287 RepID=UPI002A6ABBCC|nr:hypothetical protein [Pseudomonas aeruginosa]MDY1057946.1 hypothetical protein [Pseudomonas aeruginosa]
MSSTQHQLIEQCATRLRGIVEALDNIHDTSPHRWSTDLDDVHSSAESLLALIKDQAPTQAAQDLAFRTIAEYPCPEQDNMTAANMRQVAADAITGALAFGAQASQPPAEDHWLRPFYDIGRAEGQRTQELAMLVRMLASSLKRHAPESNLVARATNYLAAKSLAGTPLRDAPASVEQAGGDERAAFELFVRKHCGMPEHIAVNWDAKFTNDAWEGWQARAALAQPSPVRSSLLINGYQLRAALDFIAPDGTAEQLKSEACIEWRQQDADFLEAGLYAFCAEYPEEGGVLLDEEPTTAQPSPLQSEQAEAERPEVAEVAFVLRNIGAMDAEDIDGDNVDLRFEDAEGRDTGCDVSIVEYAEKAADLFEQHDRIVGELRADRDSWAEQAEQRLADWDEMRKERDAALARVAELERQEPVALANRGLHAFWVKWTEAAAGLYGPGIKLYAAPVAQAQQLNDLDKQCRDDVARALGLRPNQERGFAWSYLLASIKSCVKASGDSAQAQHSVPDGAADLCRFLAKLYCELDGLRYSTAKLPAEQIADALIFKWPVLQGARNQLNIKRISEQPYDESKLHSAIAAMLAAAPGNSVPQAWLDVQAERRRQITAEGWTPEHDDLYCAAELPRAAAAYILNGANDEAPAIWPFVAKWWKPRDARSNYVRASALILAEIERLDRAGISQSPQPGATTASS